MADFTTSTALLEGLAVLAATNPPRVWSALPHPPERVRAAVVGGSVTLAAAIVLAALASGLLDVLDIERVDLPARRRDRDRGRRRVPAVGGRTQA